MCLLLMQAFTLHFHFHPNDYFTNTVLTKEYHMKCEPSEDDPFSFEGPEIYKCTGCAVNWKQGKNLTVKTVKKKQKHKSKGNVRTVTKTVKNDSFFNFFDPVRPLGIILCNLYVPFRICSWEVCLSLFSGLALHSRRLGSSLAASCQSRSVQGWPS